jgi:hypothetical protein
LVISHPKRATDLWGWEIRRRSEPLGVKIFGKNFKSERNARLAGEKELKDFLDRIILEGD